MPKISKSIYIDWEVYQKLIDLKKDYGSIGKVLENLIREHELAKQKSELEEKKISEKLGKIEEELINIKNAVIKIAKTWGVKLE